MNNSSRMDHKYPVSPYPLSSSNTFQYSNMAGKYTKQMMSFPAVNLHFHGISQPTMFDYWRVTKRTQRFWKLLDCPSGSTSPEPGTSPAPPPFCRPGGLFFGGKPGERKLARVSNDAFKNVYSVP